MAKKKSNRMPGSVDYVTAAENMNRWLVCQRIGVIFNKSLIPNTGIWHIKEWFESEQNFLKIINFIEENL